MKEKFHTIVQVIPNTLCERCGEPCHSQEYTLTLERPHLTRAFNFCSMNCIRKWAAPIR